MSSIKIRTKQQDGFTLVRVLIDHPMETGRRRDESTGLLVPAHFITHLAILHNGSVIAEGELSTGVSRSPYVTVRLRGGQAGDRIRVNWEDNRGGRDSTEATIGAD